jgi:hypothetical protein
MRVAVVIAVACVLATTADVLAKPKVAIAPLDGDDSGKIGALVLDASDEVATVTSPKTVSKALKDLDISDIDNASSAKKLRKKLKVDAVVYGKVEKTGSKHELKLSVYTRGKKPDRFSIEYKQSSSAAFRKELRDDLENRLAPDEDNDDDNDDDTAPKEHKKSHRHRSEQTVFTQPLAYGNLGGGGYRRTLTYETAGGGVAPPRVGTFAFAPQFDGELYAAAVTDAVPPAFGVYASVARMVGLSIDVPGTTDSAPISAGHYVLGVRYRFLFGNSSFAIGAAYWNQFYTADRGSLASPTELNMADTDYKAFAPGALLRFPATPTVSVSVQLDVPLMLATGAITDGQHYGRASSLGFVARGGADIALGKNYAVHFGIFVDQVGMTFKAGALASATDRTVGASAAFALAY